MTKIRITHYGGTKEIIDKEDYNKHIGTIYCWEEIDEKLIEECKEVLKYEDNIN